MAGETQQCLTVMIFNLINNIRNPTFYFNYNIKQPTFNDINSVIISSALFRTSN